MGVEVVEEPLLRPNVAEVEGQAEGQNSKVGQELVEPLEVEGAAGGLVGLSYVGWGSEEEEKAFEAVSTKNWAF